jgi:hypothetical protein
MYSNNTVLNNSSFYSLFLVMLRDDMAQIISQVVTKCLRCDKNTMICRINFSFNYKNTRTFYLNIGSEDILLK